MTTKTMPFELLQNSIRMNTQSSTLSRQTSNLDFSAKLRQAASHGTAFAAHSLDQVSPIVPGGAVISAALHDASGALNAGFTEPALSAGSGGFPLAAGAGVGGPANLMNSMASMQQNMLSSNMMMLSVQQKCQETNQQFSLLSNVLKVKHETVRNSISNLRS